jgi:site-specific DNA-methyltransferase (adenine-specific)
MQRKYSIIYADPAYNFSNRYKSSDERITNIDDFYETMTIEDICNLPIKNLSKDNSVLFIWSTDAHLEACMKIIKSWGFTYKTIAFVWLKKEKSGKDCFIKGVWTGKSTEVCLLATKGKAYHLLKDRKVRQLIRATMGKHSEKPDEARKRIVQMFGNISRIELFAREKSEGWHVWGNEVKSNINMENYI